MSLDFEGKVANMAPGWPPKSSENLRTVDANIDQTIDAFQDGLLQVGRGNRITIDQTRHRKNDETKKTTKMSKKSQQDAPTSHDTPVRVLGERIPLKDGCSLGVGPPRVLKPPSRLFLIVKVITDV